MKILGIETSCDETAAAVVMDGAIAKSNVVATSLKEHQRFGGIIPEIASRRQIEYIDLVIKQALEQSSSNLKDIDAVAVTQEPGLLGSLLVGISYARALAYAIKKPLIPVNHIQAHLYANFVQLPGKQAAQLNELPAIGLIVSGGHTSLYDVRDIKQMRLLGQTQDDAAGEAFDKVARLLNLGYPGGPVIDKMARDGKNDKVRFPQAQLRNAYDFSFSGLKTAVLYYTREFADKPGYDVSQVVYAFQESVVQALVKKSIRACLTKGYKTLLVGGGVAANSRLREVLIEQGAKEGIKVYFPPMALCVDNAAMIAGFAYHLQGR